MEAKIERVENLSGWGIATGRTMIIAGPCSAESEEQVMQTALALGKVGISAFRAGIWKPRTRPNTFEGVGSPALEWVKDAGSAISVPVAVEVANPHHVEDCLKKGIDILWIGARTTANPFSVQAIADALKGVDIPVMVKNPVNPELELWIGALERISKAGITRLAAIHRGFSSSDKTRFRNKPKWEIPIELKRLVPDMPIVCDPSHICGNTALIPAVAQQAIDLHFDGLMIESHVNPKTALSDAKQQLTPGELAELLQGLVYKRPFLEDVEFSGEIERLRAVIDRIDMDLIDLLARRMSVVEEIGRLKEESSVMIYQPGRWDEIVKSRVKAGAGRDLSEEFVFSLFQSIHQESISHQSRRAEK